MSAGSHSHSQFIPSETLLSVQGFGENHGFKPEGAQSLNGLHESVQIHRLDHIAIGTALITCLDIAFIGGCRENDRWDFFEETIGFHCF